MQSVPSGYWCVHLHNIRVCVVGGCISLCYRECTMPQSRCLGWCAGSLLPDLVGIISVSRSGVVAHSCTWEISNMLMWKPLPFGVLALLISGFWCSCCLNMQSNLGVGFGKTNFVLGLQSMPSGIVCSLEQYTYMSPFWYCPGRIYVGAIWVVVCSATGSTKT